MFERLTLGEASVTALAESFPMSQPAISQHLSTLRAAGLVHARRDGRHQLYRADAAAMAPLVNWVDRYRTFWPAKLSKLKHVLEGMEP